MNTIRTMMVSTEVQYNITINIEESMSYSENLYTYISTVIVLYYSAQQIYLRGYIQSTLQQLQVDSFSLRLIRSENILCLSCY